MSSPDRQESKYHVYLSNEDGWPTSDTSANNNTAVNESALTFNVVNPPTGATVAGDTGIAVPNVAATDANSPAPGATITGPNNLAANYSDNGGSFASTLSTVNNAATAAAPSPTSTPTPASSPSPTLPPPSLVDAALALFFDGVQLIDDQLEGNTSFGAVFFGNSQGLAGVEASIAFNSPYAGPFAPLFVQAGEIWEYNNLATGLAEAESF